MAIHAAKVGAGRPWVQTLHEWVTTVDHKRLGILYVLLALMFLIIGGIEATIIRIQLMRPHNDFVSPQVFNRMFTMHGTTMIFFVIMPVMFGFANYLVPLMIGARDMADGARRNSSLLQFCWRQRPVWRWKCSRCGLVGIRSVDLARIFSWS
jgi:heme/copper-type cytochrome/quinol oxidase subunit 1